MLALLDDTTRWVLAAFLAGGLVSLVLRRAAWSAVGLLVLAVAAAGLAAASGPVEALPAAAGLVGLAAVLPALRSAWHGLDRVGSSTENEFVPEVPMGHASDGGVPLGLVVLSAAAGVALLSRPGTSWVHWAGGLACFLLAFGIAVVSMLRPAAVTLLAVALVWSLVVLLRSLAPHRTILAAAAVLFTGWGFVGFRSDIRVALAGAWIALVAAVSAVPVARLGGAETALLAGFPVLYLVVGTSLLKRLARSDASAGPG